VLRKVTFHIGNFFYFVIRPNILVGVEDLESLYKKWYFEFVIDHIEQKTHFQPHIRIDCVRIHFQPLPDHGDGFSSNGIDGRNAWFAGRSYDISNCVILPTHDMQHIGFKKISL
jgi:hypothetical protein